MTPATDLLDDLQWRGLIAREHRPRRPARGLRRGPGHLLLRLRPDRTQPAHRQPRADPHVAAAAAGRAPAARPGRWRDRPDRRPQARQPSAPSTTKETVARLGRPDPRADRALPVLRGRQRGRHGQQPRLDRAAVGHRLAARHRQALPGQPDDRQGGGQRPPQQRRRHLLHRVQLPDPAGAGLPRAVPPPRLRPADRWQRPVGQPDRRARPDPPGGGPDRARVRDAADHQGRRDEVRQDRVGHRVARPGDDLAVRLLPVLGQRRRPRRGDLPQGVLASARGRRSRRWRRPRPSGRRPARRSAPWPRS